MIDPSTLKFGLRLKTANGILQEAFNLKAEDVDKIMNCLLLGQGRPFLINETLSISSLF